jgi:hypothetical protein
MKDLMSVIDYVKPTVLMGWCKFVFLSSKRLVLFV